MIHRFRLATAVACVVAVPATSTFAQNDMQATPGDLPPAADLIASALEGISSADARREVTSMSIQAEMDMGGMSGEVEGPQTATVEAKLALPNRFHLVATLAEEGTATATFDGKHGWDRDPGQLDYGLMDDGEERMFNLIVPHGWLLSLAEGSSEATTKEVIEIDGARHYRIGINGAEGDAPIDLFIAADTGRFAAIETTDPAGSPARVTITEWKDFGGLTLPSAARLDVGMGEIGQKIAFAYTSVEYNNVEDAAFAMPEEVKRQIEEDGGGDAATDDGAASGATGGT